MTREQPPSIGGRESASAIRPARPAEYARVMAILEGALLDVDTTGVRERLDGETTHGSVLVATESDRLLGVLLREDNEVTAIAVRPGRRGQGIGAALVHRAADQVDGTLVAEFDADVREFYESIGFTVEMIDERTTEERYRGRLP